MEMKANPALTFNSTSLVQIYTDRQHLKIGKNPRKNVFFQLLKLRPDQKPTPK